jgi:hypothetical protein
LIADVSHSAARAHNRIDLNFALDARVRKSVTPSSMAIQSDAIALPGVAIQTLPSSSPRVLQENF